MSRVLIIYRRKWVRNLSNKPKQKSTYTMIPLCLYELITYRPWKHVCPANWSGIVISYLGPRPASYLHPLGVFSYQLSWHYGPGGQSREKGKSQIPRFSLDNIVPKNSCYSGVSGDDWNGEQYSWIQTTSHFPCHKSLPTEFLIQPPRNRRIQYGPGQ